MMMTGRRPSVNGYSKTHPILVDFNPTLASVLKGAGYETTALVDNPNVAARYGYSKGFDRYRETWEEQALDERGGAHARDHRRGAWRSCGTGARRRRSCSGCTTSIPTRRTRRRLPTTPPSWTRRRGRRGGFPSFPASTAASRSSGRWPGRTASATTSRSTTARSPPWTRKSAQVLDALAAAGLAGKTVVVLTSDHGESLGEHDYYFDHGEDLFEPSMAIPLILAAARRARRRAQPRAGQHARPRPDRPRSPEGLLSSRPRRREPAGGVEGPGLGRGRPPVRPERAEPHRHLG